MIDCVLLINESDIKVFVFTIKQGSIKQFILLVDKMGVN